MHTRQQIITQINALYFGGNYTGVHFTKVLQEITYKEAVTKIKDFNTIHTLVFHTQYYLDAVIQVLEGNTLEAKDPLSFIHDPIHSEEAWNKLVQHMFTRVKVFTKLIERMPEKQLYMPFEKEAYGSYFRNIVGVIEHSHYHLGQIVFLKKMMH